MKLIRALLAWLLRPEPDVIAYLAPEAEASPHSRPAILTLEDQ